MHVIALRTKSASIYWIQNYFCHYGKGNISKVSMLNTILSSVLRLPVELSDGGPLENNSSQCSFLDALPFPYKGPSFLSQI
jgi:hypothetical protein